MRVIVVGAGGVLGSAVAAALAGRHEVVPVSRTTRPSVDLADPASVERLFIAAGRADAVVSCAASALPTPLLDEGFPASIQAKLHGQVALARAAAVHLRDGGSITLTTGSIPAGMAGIAGGALVNAGLEAFVRAAPADLDRGLRINAISPGWVAETLVALDMDPARGTPAALVAEAYVAAVEADITGEVLRPGRVG